MGRPRRHDERTRAALLDAAERIVEADGVDALSVRGVADAVGTTTRAVYTVFGSKDGMLVALGERAFQLLGAAVRELPVTGDPAADLVAAGAVAFRGFALVHPALFEIGIQRTALPPGVPAGFSGTAASALRGLQDRIVRVAAQQGIGSRPVPDATWQFHALCEGLAALELRQRPPKITSAWRPGSSPEHALTLWTDALGALIEGWRRCPGPDPAA